MDGCVHIEWPRRVGGVRTLAFEFGPFSGYLWRRLTVVAAVEVW